MSPLNDNCVTEYRERLVRIMETHLRNAHQSLTPYFPFADLASVTLEVERLCCLISCNWRVLMLFVCSFLSDDPPVIDVCTRLTANSSVLKQLGACPEYIVHGSLLLDCSKMRGLFLNQVPSLALDDK